MKKISLSLVGFLLMFVFANLLAQTPQYYNYQNVGTSSNSFPFGQTAGKEVQWLFLANDFNQPIPLPPGNMITKVYFYVSTGGTRTYSSLTIKLGQTGITTLPTGAWYTGQLDTVYHATNVMLTGAVNNWMSVTLDTPFPYNPAQSLVIDVTQCSSTGTGISVRQNGLSGFRRSYSGTTTGCPFLFGGQDASIVNFGVDVVPVPAITAPDYLYYKFENNPSSSTILNCGDPGVGAPMPTFSGLTLASGGQFDSCISGTAVNGAGIVTGWNNSLGTSSWTISMWLEATTTTFGYIFGDGAGSFRCFNNGAAGTNAITLRGTGITNVNVTGFASGPVVVHFVYDSALANIKVYKNGVLSSTVAQTPLNLAAGTGFKVGGYLTNAGFMGKMDEFRLYRRALDSAEVASTWDTDIPCGSLVPVTINNNYIPKTYSLDQNYPNPFNPSTNFKFSIPKSGSVDLKIYDMLGREVAVIVHEFKQAGTYSVEFNASSLSSGVYFYTLRSDEFTDTKKMVLIK